MRLKDTGEILFGTPKEQDGNPPNAGFKTLRQKGPCPDATLESLMDTEGASPIRRGKSLRSQDRGSGSLLLLLLWRLLGCEY